MFLHYNMFFMYSNRQLALPSILLNGPRGEQHNLPTIYILIFNMNDFFIFIQCAHFLLFIQCAHFLLVAQMYMFSVLALPFILLNGPRGERHNLPTIYILIFNMNDFFILVDDLL
ncbi:hypothetical protein ACJX0J_028267 [Zea mays]